MLFFATVLNPQAVVWSTRRGCGLTMRAVLYHASKKTRALSLLCRHSLSQRTENIKSQARTGLISGTIYNPGTSTSSLAISCTCHVPAKGFSDRLFRIVKCQFGWIRSRVVIGILEAVARPGGDMGRTGVTTIWVMRQIHVIPGLVGIRVGLCILTSYIRFFLSRIENAPGLMLLYRSWLCVVWWNESNRKNNLVWMW